MWCKVGKWFPSLPCLMEGYTHVSGKNNLAPSHCRARLRLSYAPIPIHRADLEASHASSSTRLGLGHTPFSPHPGARLPFPSQDQMQQYCLMNPIARATPVVFDYILSIV